MFTLGVSFLTTGTAENRSEARAKCGKMRRCGWGAVWIDERTDHNGAFYRDRAGLSRGHIRICQVPGARPAWFPRTAGRSQQPPAAPRRLLRERNWENDRFRKLWKGGKVWKQWCHPVPPFLDPARCAAQWWTKFGYQLFSHSLDTKTGPEQIEMQCCNSRRLVHPEVWFILHYILLEFDHGFPQVTGGRM